MLQQKKNNLITNIPVLDQKLFGGIPSSSITEIASLHGLGKTNFMLTLCVESLFAHPKSSVIFIDTENSFNAERLLEIGTKRKNFENLKETFNNIIRIEIFNSKELFECLNNLERTIVEKNVKLILLDSVASLVKNEFGSKNVIQRQDTLAQEAQKLKFLSESFSIPIVVTNHVLSKKEESTPLLGNTWAHCVNTRLILEVKNSQKLIKIAKSPVSDVIYIPFKIDETGIVTDEEKPVEKLNNDEFDLDGINISDLHNE